MAKTYTVKNGDTLWQIAADHGTSYQTLAKINGLPIVKKNGGDYVYLVVGQVIKLEASTGSSAAKVTTSKVSIKTFGLQSGSERGMYVTWAWDKEHTKEYQVEWSEYYDGYWHYTTNTTTNKYNEFTAQAQATSARVRVKPVSTTYEDTKGREVAHWTNVVWTSRSSYSFSNNPPKPTDIPDVDILYPENTDGKDIGKLHARLENLADLNANIIEFQLAKNGTPLSNSTKVKIDAVSAANAEITVETGSIYKIRARSWRSEQCSAYSAWSTDYRTRPSKPVIDKCMAGADDKSIELSWESVASATGYKIQYAPTSDENGQTIDYFANPVNGGPPYTLELKDDDPRIKTCAAIISENIEATKNYRVRIVACNSEGDSQPSEESITSTDAGPLAPTAFTDKAIYSVGELINLQWVHNHKYEDNNNGSTENNNDSNKNYYAKWSHIDLYIDDGSGAGFIRKPIATVPHLKDDMTSVDTSTNGKYTYTIYIAGKVDEENAAQYDAVCPNGCIIKWRVRTAEDNGVYGEWSAMRTVYVYAAPTLELSRNGIVLTGASTVRLERFPLEVTAVTGPKDIQRPIGYHVEVKANKTHEAIDNYGETITILENEVVYAQSFDDVNGNEFTIGLTAGDVLLMNDESYTVTCTVAMNSGLSVESGFTLIVALANEAYTLDAEIYIDETSYTASIRPYCEDSSGQLVSNTMLYVYRREYDGSFTRISGDLDNTMETFVTDPHPALDYARYRIVSINQDTQQMNYADLPGIPVNGKSIVIQWDENWHPFNIDNDYEEDPVSWSGSMLVLPYNIDVQNRYSPDVSLIEYIGRENPVSYYGTQHGESATWNVEILKTDTNTIYALRRLAKYMGDVYVREPSGTGYWANITVSFNIKHRSLTIPVALGVTKVEGGM